MGQVFASKCINGLGLTGLIFLGLIKIGIFVNNYNIMRNGIHFVPRRSIVSVTPILPQDEWC